MLDKRLIIILDSDKLLTKGELIEDEAAKMAVNETEVREVA